MNGPGKHRLIGKWCTGSESPVHYRTLKSSNHRQEIGSELSKFLSLIGLWIAVASADRRQRVMPAVIPPLIGVARVLRDSVYH